MNKKLLTLVILHDKETDRVLLGKKKRGFGEGKWNGFGGKVEQGEVIIDAARREMEEEAGITLHALSFVGTLTFREGIYQRPSEVHLFRAESWEGEPRESDEMLPHWFARADIPLQDMFPDDQFWYPHFFAGDNFSADFVFDDQGNILDHSITLSHSDMPSRPPKGAIK